MLCGRVSLVSQPAQDRKSSKQSGADEHVIISEITSPCTLEHAHFSTISDQHTEVHAPDTVYRR